VKPARELLTRPQPDTALELLTRPELDTRPPKEFQDAGGMPERVVAKHAYMESIKRQSLTRSWRLSTIAGSPEYREALLSVHPRLPKYTMEKKLKAIQALLVSHPKFRAEMGKWRNEMLGIPNHATSRRVMSRDEQTFLTNAMHRIREEVERDPFHMHGESGVLGAGDGGLTWFGHNPEGCINIPRQPGDKYHLHSHPPLAEPFTSSASEQDHKVASMLYRYMNDKKSTYVTNGKDVLLIQPDSLELIKLIPDSNLQNELGKFPEAFRLPKPQLPPRPFSSHEAPIAFKDNWAPPAGWQPPSDYPRDEAVEQNAGASTSRKRPAPPTPPEDSQPAKSARSSEASGRNSQA
jgi:hypothetical protein